MKRTSLVLVLSGLILLMGCGGGGNSGSSNPPSNPPSPAATLTSLQVTPASQSLAPGAGQQFTATGHYSDGTSKDLTSSAQWSSSDSNVASVSGTGMATAVAFGAMVTTGPAPNALRSSSDLTRSVMSKVTIRIGVRVPRQLSVVGFDDIRFARHMAPPLTTIAQPMRQIGEGTVRLLLGILSGGGDAETPESVTLPHKLVVRASTAPPASRLK